MNYVVIAVQRFKTIEFCCLNNRFNGFYKFIYLALNGFPFILGFSGRFDNELFYF
jgi:hypothetical protein